MRFILLKWRFNKIEVLLRLSGCFICEVSMGFPGKVNAGSTAAVPGNLFIQLKTGTNGRSILFGSPIKTAKTCTRPAKLTY